MTIHYLWFETPEDLDNTYEFSNDNNHIIQFSRLNFFIGKNNSGKSRFLRKLFVYNEIRRFDNFKLSQSLEQIKNIPIPIASNTNQLQHAASLITNFTKLCNCFLTENLDAHLHKDLEFYFMCNNFIKKAMEVRSIMHIFRGSIIPPIIEEIIFQIKSLINQKWNRTRFYIPILRGMRPVLDKTTFPYLTRTKNDYFSKAKISDNQIITGENLYSILQKQSLGKSHEWQRVRLYEQKLSQYFFNGETVTLIPELDADVISIKIGDDEQFPISQLGDGLQQVIILTYQAFIEQDVACSFFIEEPELHMHAGMVRQLMNFYLNETQHYYFFTTHSNHLLDMADESDEVIIQKFVKENHDGKTEFKIYRCDRDRDLLALLGIKPSSVYLANCTIWVEGITDRLYLVKYMQKYLEELKEGQPEKYQRYLRFMPNFHYAFVEYAGGNIVHWDFSDEFAENLDDKGLSAKAIASEMLLIADGDNREKALRVFEWNKELGEQNLVILSSKEMENTLPFDAIIEVAKTRFASMKRDKSDWDIDKLDNLTDKNYFISKDIGIGRLLDEKIKQPENETDVTIFADGKGVGTIADKLKFCRKIIEYFDNNPNWQLTDEAHELCERIYQHIENCNKI